MDITNWVMDARSPAMDCNMHPTYQDTITLTCVLGACYSQWQDTIFALPDVVVRPWQVDTDDI